MTAGEAGVDHRALAVEYFNAAWDLIDLEARTAEQSRDLLGLALASRHHWREVVDAGEDKLIISDWQVAYAASLGGFADVAMAFAQAAVERAETADVPTWLKASAHEGLARAHAAAGDAAGCDREAEVCRELLAAVDDEDNRALIQGQLESIPRPA